MANTGGGRGVRTPTNQDFARSLREWRGESQSVMAENSPRIDTWGRDRDRGGASTAESLFDLVAPLALYTSEAEAAGGKALGKAAKAGARATKQAAPDVGNTLAKAQGFAVTPETTKLLDVDPVRMLFGTKHAEEAKIAKKVEKQTKKAEAAAPEDKTVVKRKKEDIAKVPADVYRTMYAERGIEPVLEAARAGEHLRPDASGGFIGTPRHVQTRQAITQLRNRLDSQLGGGAEALSVAEREAGTPERFGTWYQRAKKFNEDVNEPYQLPRWLEGVGTYSAGVAPESELAFNLKHWNSRALGDPQMAYRGAPMRSLDTAVAENRPANLGFKIGEYAKKNDPRIVDESPFGVNDFRMAQTFGYTDPKGNPWKAGVSGTMHPVMDAETALMVERANKSNLGGVSNWTGERAQEIPWVAGKAQDLYERGKTGRFGGGREGMIKALREANNTAADYAPKHTLEVPGAWGDEGKDVLYSALGLRQLPIEGDTARPLMDFATQVTPKVARERGIDVVKKGTLAPTTEQAVRSTEQMRALLANEPSRTVAMQQPVRGGTGAITVPGIGPEQGTGQYTAAMLEELAKTTPHASANLSESPAVRSQIRQQMLRDATRADLQKTRQFMSDADWAKAVEMIRNGVKPAAAVAALGYSLSGMAAEQQGEPR